MRIETSLQSSYTFSYLVPSGQDFDRAYDDILRLEQGHEELPSFLVERRNAQAGTVTLRCEEQNESALIEWLNRHLGSKRGL